MCKESTAKSWYFVGTNGIHRHAMATAVVSTSEPLTSHTPTLSTHSVLVTIAAVLCFGDVPPRQLLSKSMT